MAPGNKFVAVDLKLRNRGKVTLKNAFLNTTLTTGDGRSYTNTFGYPAGQCDKSADDDVPRGQTRVSCALFEIPSGATLRLFSWKIYGAKFKTKTLRWQF